MRLYVELSKKLKIVIRNLENVVNYYVPVLLCHVGLGLLVLLRFHCFWDELGDAVVLVLFNFDHLPVGAVPDVVFDLGQELPVAGVERAGGHLHQGMLQMRERTIRIIEILGS
jgi:hypothetical protein